MKYYLAGPMSGYPKYNFPNFDLACKDLRIREMEILSPHEINHGENENTRGSLPYEHYLKAGLKLLLECDSIILLPGWEYSNGAVLEMKVATRLNYSRYTYDPKTQHLRIWIPS